MILPERVFGRPGAHWMMSGRAMPPISLTTQAPNSLRKSSLGCVPTIKVTYKVGQKVRIIDGPFNDFMGLVAAIDQDKSKVRVMVNFFGRDTPVELDFLEVEKV